MQKYLSVLLLVLFFPSCAATGFARKAPVSVAAQGPVKAFVWSALTTPDTWDKSYSPLDYMEPATPLLVRGTPSYWRNVFDPSYH